MLDLDRALFPQLSGNTVYADWTGAAQPPAHLIEEHAAFLTQTLLGNPHSHHASSVRAMGLVEEARAEVLAFLNADADEYDVIFTPNASGGILLLQHYLWNGGELLLSADNHNTVNGLREIARRAGAVARYAPLKSCLAVDDERLRHMLTHPRTNHTRVFGFPAQSNYAGTMHDLEWVSVANAHGWDVLLDAAAFLANNDLDLRTIKPAFVPISFYKLFGFPTGMGCLVIRKDVFKRMHKKWFAGGTILLVSVMADFYALEPIGHARFEDGTVNFQSMAAITRGLRWLKSIGDRKAHAMGIAQDLHERIRGMSEGRGSIRIHSPRDTTLVTFDVLRDGEVVNAWEVERSADAAGIQFRTGCFCNPGGNERVMGYTVKEFEQTYNDGATADDFTLERLRERSGGKPIGASRASFGYANRPEDAVRIAQFLKHYLGTL